MKQAHDVPLQIASPRMALRALKPDLAAPSIADEVAAGLDAMPKTLPCKYFYDDHGSQLFERICQTPEYYPWRMEHALLARHAPEIMALAAPEHLIELGSGTSTKTCRLLDACAASRHAPVYTPIDVCAEMVRDASIQLTQRYPWLQVQGLVGDYLAGLTDLGRRDGPSLFVFLGGTIGNFDDVELEHFAHTLRCVMSPGDRLLLGVDLIKESARLDAAYNDAQGHTRAFNLNILKVLNARLAAHFRLAAFRHHAFYDPERARIEMHLVAEEEHRVPIGVLRRTFTFAEGESIRTEISRKFDLATVASQFDALGFSVEQQWVSREPQFSLMMLSPSGYTVQRVQ